MVFSHIMITMMARSLKLGGVIARLESVQHKSCKTCYDSIERALNIFDLITYKTTN